MYHNNNKAEINLARKINVHLVKIFAKILARGG